MSVQKSDLYLTRLLGMYSGTDDQESLSAIRDMVHRKDYLDRIASFRENEHTKILLQNVLTRYQTMAKRLMTDSTMSEEERKLIFVAMDWATWFFEAIGGDIEKLKKSLNDAINTAAERAGVNL